MNTFKNTHLIQVTAIACLFVNHLAYAQLELINDNVTIPQNEPTHAPHETTIHDHGHEVKPAHVAVNTTATGSKEHGHLHGDVDQHLNTNSASEVADHSSEIKLTKAQLNKANVIVAPATKSILEQRIYAPGEIKANGYKSYVVSPRIESVVISRHAILGQHVSVGEPLVTLFSETMAEAQASYRVAFNDWQRAKKLAKGTVSDSQLLADETKYIASLSKLKAFGLTTQAIENIINNNSSSLGEYTLIALRAGAVLQDDFSQGQRVSAGETIMVLADESTLWVEAKVSANKPLNIPVGAKAEIRLGNHSYQGNVIQEAHTIDPITRTRTIRLAVTNTHDKLHPGMFVDVYFAISSSMPVIAVPEQALMRNEEGHWTVFVEDEIDTFKAIEVKRGRQFGQKIEIWGIQANQHIVMQGAFFVASELAKSGFDPHNH